MSQFERGRVDWYIFLAISLLLLFSAAFVFSASSAYSEYKFGESDKLFWNHASKVILGFFCVFLFSRLDYKLFIPWTRTILSFAIVLLVAVLLIGTETKGAARWLHIGPLNFQPSEFAKFALVLHIASIIAERKAVLTQFKDDLLPIFLWLLVVAGLIAIQPNYSNALAISITIGAMVLACKVKAKHIALGATFMVVALGVVAVAAPYRLARIKAFIGQSDASTSKITYQSEQALIALGSGGISGRGIGESKQRDWFLPESYGDFIFSIVGEEYGFIGTFLLLSCFVVILLRGFSIARATTNDFGKFLALGTTLTFVLYAMVNMGVNTNLLPTTGLPLPFISYGGTAVIFSCVAVGVLLNISSYSRKPA